jgi:secondary thiamine-phosphate synthase enzyme
VEVVSPHWPLRQRGLRRSSVKALLGASGYQLPQVRRAPGATDTRPADGLRFGSTSGVDLAPRSAHICHVHVHQELITVTTTRSGLLDITSQVQACVQRSGITTGLCTVFVQHTSASLVIQENADPSVLADLQSWMAEVAPESRQWQHADEGADDMPAHARGAITRTSEAIPVGDARLLLGTWQGLYLWEHRSRPHTRKLVVHLAGVSGAGAMGRS